MKLHAVSCQGRQTVLIKKFRITNYKSISDSGSVELGEKTTVLVGRNESGKTAVLEALHKAWPSDDNTPYDYIEDYPRRNLTQYRPKHAQDPALVAEIEYEFENADIAAVIDFLDFDIKQEISLIHLHHIDNSTRIRLSFDEGPFIEHLLGKLPIPRETRDELTGVSTLRELLDSLTAADLNAEATEAVLQLNNQFDTKTHWPSVVANSLYENVLRSRIPPFAYFDDYAMLPAKVNLRNLCAKEQRSLVDESDNTVLSLLRLAGVSAESLANADGYESAKAQLEGISNRITDDIFELWTQNQHDATQELEVQFDLADDPRDVAPFDNGPNLYIRIRGLKHRVSVPFDKRSKGFKWFVSFVVWFENVKQHLGAEDRIVLLLDEPGLSLHALAQADLLRYFDRLSEKHQIIFTTHSPFMVRSDRLSDVRLVEDVPKKGTTVSSDVAGGDSRTIFPLQAALGYSIAQNLFLGSKNLLVEGPSDFLYLQSISGVLQRAGREGLRDDVVIMPVGGLDKLATFVALLAGNELSFVVLHDWSKAPEQRLTDLVRQRLVSKKAVLNYGMFMGEDEGSTTHADIEDLFDAEFFVELFSEAFQKELGQPISASSLPRGARIVERLGRHMKENNLAVRDSDGFNHFRPASFLTANPAMLGKVPNATLDRFEQLFNRVNAQFE